MADEIGTENTTRRIPSSAVLPRMDEAAAQPIRGEVRRRRWRKAGYTVGAAACFFSLAVGSVFGHFYWGSATFRDLFNRHGIEAAGGMLTGKGILNSWTPERQFQNRSVLNVLVLGIDHDYDNKRQIIKNTWGRSDAILMARVDFQNKTISALSIPRDSAVRIRGYRGVHKINAAHSWKGPSLTVETIKNALGVQADAVVSVNFEAFQKLVDAIGGVEVNVTKRLKYDDNWGGLHVDLHPGRQRLDGYQAMGYVRIRKSDSDTMRSQRQQEFLESVRNQVKTPETLLALPKVIDTLSDNINVVNLSRDQMFTLMNFARTLDRQNIHVETLPSIEGRSFVTIDVEKGEEVIQRLFFPNQQVALNIEAPNMSGRRRTARRSAASTSSTSSTSSAPRRTGSTYVRPSAGLSVETPSSTQGSTGTPSQPPEGDSTSREETSAKPSEPVVNRAVG